MGKFSTRIYNPDIFVPDDLIEDIHRQLCHDKKVVIIHNSSEHSRQAAQSLIKKIPSDDLIRVRVIEQGDFEQLRTLDPQTNYYRISAEGILPYIANRPDLSTR